MLKLNNPLQNGNSIAEKMGHGMVSAAESQHYWKVWLNQVQIQKGDKFSIHSSLRKLLKLQDGF